MTSTFASNAGRGSASARSATAMALAVASILASGDSALAQGCEATSAPTMAQGQATKELEQAYWACDYATTNHAYDRGTAMACSVTYEKLKAQKFNGDFCQMLAWWRQQKAAMHQALSTAEHHRSELPLASKR